MFIAIDGPDGIGKTTISKRVIEKLKADYKMECTLTTEPSRSPLGLEIRNLLSSGNVSNKILLDMFLKDRKEHIENEIAPALAENQLILTDRYKYSTIVYQFFQGFEIEELIKMNNFLAPHITFIINGTFELIQERMEKRGSEKEIFEQDEFIKKSINLYSQMNAFFPTENIVFIDGTKNIDEIEKEIIDYILEYKE